MSIRKILAVVVMLAALFAVIYGVPYANSYIIQGLIQTSVFSENRLVPVNATDQIHVKLNGTEAMYFVRLEVSNGTIRGAVLQKEEFKAWVNGSYAPQWCYEQPTSEFGGLGYGRTLGNAPVDYYHVLWNPDAPYSRNVTLTVYESKPTIAYNYQNIGIFVFSVGGGGVVGLAAANSLGKRMLLTVVALTLIVLGISFLTAQPQILEGREIVGTTSIIVPAEGTTNIPLHYNTTDYYTLTLDGANGRLNTTVVSEIDFSAGDLDSYWSMWRGSLVPISGVPMGVPTQDVRLVLVNPEDFDEQVSVQVDRLWPETSYTSNISGALVLTFGVAVLLFANRRLLTEFHRAL